jgi:tyrosine-protein phosphatase YwqE
VLDTARARGALLQVVAPSLAGRSGSETAIAAWRLVRSGRVDLLGSDSHRPRSRRLPLNRALELLVARTDATLLTDITVKVPTMLVGGTIAS